MPDPQSVLSDDMNEDLDEDFVQENDNSSSATKLDPAVSTTQIKNTIQEKKEAPKTKPEILNENISKAAIQSFQDLINLANKNREIELKFDLERNVRLVKFEQGKIDISFNENLSKDFIKNLSQKLIEWTGKRWIITLSKDQGKTTVHEIKQQVKAKLIEEMKQTDEYKKILEAFPDAELIDVQDKEED
jgi:DNA polymerase-3 subunit gamma/tau